LNEWGENGGFLDGFWWERHLDKVSQVSQVCQVCHISEVSQVLWEHLTALSGWLLKIHLGVSHQRSGLVAIFRFLANNICSVGGCPLQQARANPTNTHLLLSIYMDNNKGYLICLCCGVQGYKDTWTPINTIFCSLHHYHNFTINTHFWHKNS